MGVTERADVYNVHADWCSGGCPRWLATGAPTCVPYPCRCDETKASAPQFVKDWGEVTCWWRRKTDGALTSRCPCWGDDREGKPESCCSWHVANPRFLDDRHSAFLALLDAAEDPGDAAMDGPGKTPPNEPDPLAWDHDGEPWSDRRRPVEPYVRRWPLAELYCPCKLPKDVKGIHCTKCHQRFANEMAFGMHQKTPWDACREPTDVRDVDTGAALLAPNFDGAWAVDWAANVGRWMAAKLAAQRSDQRKRAD